MSRTPPGPRYAGACLQIRSISILPSGPASSATAARCRGSLSDIAGMYGGLATIRSKDSPFKTEKRSPRRTSIRVRWARALSRALVTARLVMSTATTRAAPARAAAMASAPVPVQMSATAAPAIGSRHMAAASSQVSLTGRCTPGALNSFTNQLFPGQAGTNRVEPPDFLPPGGAALSTLFDAPRPLSIGIEEEIMLLDPETLDLQPCAPALLERSGLDGRFKTELPAAHLEIASFPCSDLKTLGDQLLKARMLVLEAAEGTALPASAGVHPFAARLGKLNSSGRYARIQAEYGFVASQQLICGLHVHVALSGADRMLGVYNAMREYLPDLAALAANAPVYQGLDTGMASVRPSISAMLPRQGIPPHLASWDAFASELAWAGAARRLWGTGQWWWELRPHAKLGTLEIRVPDAQTTVQDTMAVCSVIAGLVTWLAEHLEVTGNPVPGWRLDENRWSAARHGIDGHMADLATGHLERTRDRLERLIDAISPAVEGLAGGMYLDAARELVNRNGAHRQRRMMAQKGPAGLTAWLAGQFTQAD